MNFTLTSMVDARRVYRLSCAGADKMHEDRTRTVSSAHEVTKHRGVRRKRTSKKRTACPCPMAEKERGIRTPHCSLHVVLWRSPLYAYNVVGYGTIVCPSIHLSSSTARSKRRQRCELETAVRRG